MSVGRVLQELATTKTFKNNGTVKSFLSRPLFLQEESPAAGVSFFAPERLRKFP